MRVGVRGKELVAVTVLACAIVATASALHLSHLSRLVVQDGRGQAELVAKQIHAQTARALARAAGRKPDEALRRDRDLRSLLDASVGYSPHLLYAALVDQSGRVLLHTEPATVGAKPTSCTLPSPTAAPSSSSATTPASNCWRVSLMT